MWSRRSRTPLPFLANVIYDCIHSEQSQSKCSAFGALHCSPAIRSGLKPPLTADVLLLLFILKLIILKLQLILLYWLSNPLSKF